jgi:Domain of unknown function (DUF4399)
MKTAIAAAALALLLTAPVSAEQQATPSAAGAKVFIIEPKDGATVSNPVTVKFGIEGMEVAPAGTDKPNSGHHHLIIDASPPELTGTIPADANHVHFGKGQTETTIELKPGVHTLQLLLGDQNHMPHSPPVVSDTVNIVVK